MASIFNGFLEYRTSQELDEYLISKLDKETALKLLELSIETLQGQGAYTLVESYALYMCLNKLKEEPKTEDDV
jgi:hypothetical protein